jgi:hypothetical protein
MGSSSAAVIAPAGRSGTAKAGTRSRRSDSCRLASSTSAGTCSIGTWSPGHSAHEERSTTMSGAHFTPTK